MPHRLADSRRSRCNRQARRLSCEPGGSVIRGSDGKRLIDDDGFAKIHNPAEPRCCIPAGFLLTLSGVNDSYCQTPTGYYKSSPGGIWYCYCSGWSCSQSVNGVYQVPLVSDTYAYLGRIPGLQVRTHYASQQVDAWGDPCPVCETELPWEVLHNRIAIDIVIYATAVYVTVADCWFSQTSRFFEAWASCPDGNCFQYLTFPNLLQRYCEFDPGPGYQKGGGSGTLTPYF